MRTLSLIICCSLASLAATSYCGQSGIPFSFEALANGQPILGCARPTCFGWNADGKRSADAAQFYKIGKQSDGFLRATDTHGPIIKNATYFRPQFSVCDRTYMWEQCVGPNQWVGGISPLAKVNQDSAFRVMCCTYSQLSQAVDQGVAEIKSGQTVVGGEINGEDGRQHSFEYISNIRRGFNEQGEVVYSVTMKRFPCLPEPETTETNVEKGTTEDLIKNAEKVQKPATQFAAPTVQFQQQQQQQQQQQPVHYQSQAAPTFSNMRFDLPNQMPAEDPQRQQYQQQQQQPQYQQQYQYQQQQPSQYYQQPGSQQYQYYQQPLQQATTEVPTSTSSNPSSGCRKLPNGKSAPCAKVYPEEDSQQQPVAIPQQQENGAAQAKQGAPSQQQQQSGAYSNYQQQQQNQYYQSSVWDPLGLFRHSYTAPTYQQPQSAVQSIPQPNQSYNPYWPVQGYYDYSQNPSATYGVQTSQNSLQSQPLVAQGTKTAIPRPKPLPVPTIEDVEKAIPPAGRRMIYNVAKTLLNL